MKPNAILLTFLLALTGTFVYSQNNTLFLNRAADSLEKQTINRPVEKVYLHFDKPRYAIGDTIWFKAYTVLDDPHQLSGLSGILYAELINANDSIVKRLRGRINPEAIMSVLILSGCEIPAPSIFSINAYRSAECNCR
jgi:hypothetical protein